jgi:hypothetical protein
VGLPAKSPLTVDSEGGSRSRGIALPSAMFALVAASLLLAGALAFATLSVRATGNQERATRALHVADAGMSHAVSILRASPLKSLSYTRILNGSDNVANTADDSLFIDYAGLAAGDQIPLAGKAFQGGSYFVTIQDDPADTDLNPRADMNGRVLVRCRSLMNDGATAEVAAIVAAVPMPGFAADGNVNFSGGPTINGACGTAHANGNLGSAGGGPTVGISASATGVVSGNWNKPDGTAAPKVNGASPVDIPDLNPMDYCGSATYRLLSTGMVQTVATGAQVPFLGTGWTYNAVTLTWSFGGAPILPGTYCVTGNVAISGNNGAAGAPLQVSILATGSISVTGNTYLAPFDADGILLMAAGDILAAGNPGSAYAGLIYAGAQCLAQGSATFSGQLMCANGAQPAGATAYAATTTVQGSFTLNSDCSGTVLNKRRVLYWYPRVGA